MSLNNIELGNWIVSELYRDSLLATETPYVSAHPVPARPSSASAETAPAPGPMPASAVEQSPILASAIRQQTALTATGQEPPPGQQTSTGMEPPSGQRGPLGQETPLPQAGPAQIGSTPASPAPAAARPGLASLAASVHGKNAPPVSATETNTPARPTPGTNSPSHAPTSPASPTVPDSATLAGSGPNVPTGYKFLGTNRRHITILVQSPGVAFLPDDQLSFLTRMLEACKMNMGDVAIVNQATAPVNITALKQQLQPATLLLFGMEPVDIRLPMNFPVFKIQDYDGCTYLSAPSLQELVQPGDESKLLKSKLWICLKTIFGI